METKIKIWRMENEDGIGPFRGGNYEVSQILNYDNPECCIDCKHTIQDNEKVGCISLYQLKKWFTNYSILKKNGFKIIRKECNKIVAKGEYQVIFI